MHTIFSWDFFEFFILGLTAVHVCSLSPKNTSLRGPRLVANLRHLLRIIGIAILHTNNIQSVCTTATS